MSAIIYKRFAGMLAIILFMLSSSEVMAKFRPKEYDVTLITASKNCSTDLEFAQGLCQGGNWAHTFASALHLAKCVKSSVPFPRLASEELLQCVTASFDKCADIPQNTDIVTTIKAYLLTSGLTTESCLAYKQTQNSRLDAPACPDQCDDSASKTMQAQAVDIIELTDAVSVQDHILSYGNAILAIEDRQGQYEYSSGNYSAQADEPSYGIRFLLIVGWSTSATNEVIWKAVNTFGSDYGQSGRINISSLSPDIQKYYVLTPVL